MSKDANVNDYNDCLSSVTFTETGINGGFFSNPDETWKLMRLASLGQSILATPYGLSKLWGVESRVIGKIIHKLRCFYTIEGDAWVRNIVLDDTIIKSSSEFGSTLDLDWNIQMGYKLPEGPVSHWRGRPLAANLRRQVLERDGKRCAYCGEEAKKIHIDHIVPVTKGGLDTLDNLTVSCAPCNLSKSDKLLSEWGGRE